jgi:hypothetical protein
MLRFVCYFIAVVMLALFAPATIAAQGPTPTPTPTSPLPPTSESVGEVVTFSLLGFKDRTMRGPYDQSSVVFSLPADWRLTEGAKVEITFSTSFSGSGAPLTRSGSTPVGAQSAVIYSGSLEMVFNGVSLGAVVLDRAGERTVTLPIPLTALTTPSRSGRSTLQFVLNTVGCEFDWQTTVVIQATSRFILPHQFASPLMDLKLLPRPVYQASFVADAALLIVPNKPTPTELQAALAVAAGFGRMSLGKLTLTLLEVGKLSVEQQKAHHLIFVGNAEDFPILNSALLPAPATATGFNAVGAHADDGIIQMALSPLNPLRVWLIVGGNTDAAITKAGQAISASAVRVTTQLDLALVSEVRSELVAAELAVDRTLTALGYSGQTIQDLGFNTFEIRFYVPSNQTVTNDAYFELAFNHSALIDYDKSGLLVRLNDEPIGSVRFADETAKLTTTRIAIPRTSIRPGVNRLTIESALFPRFVCADPRTTLLWLTIRPESLLHLPLTPESSTNTRAVDLSAYPQLLTVHPLLGTTAFVLPPTDPTAWNVAAQIAAHLGNESVLAMADLVVAYADAVPDAVRQARDLVLVGRPSTLPILNEKAVSDALPTWFEPGSDLALERNVRVVYRIPANASVGYLEVLPAPWNAKRVIFAILGTNEQGIQAAANALILSRLRNRLSGNYAFVNGEQIVVGDSRIGPTVSGVAPTAAPGGTTQLPTTSSPDAPLPDQRPAWILPALGVSISLMVLIVLIVAVSAWLQRSRTR